MTVLAVIQRVSSKIGVRRPETLFASAEREHEELADAVNETAIYIAKAHEWNTLKRQTVYTGNGTTDAFPLPDDYDRMPVDQRVWTSELEVPLIGPMAHDDWMQLLVRDYATVIGSWTLLGGEMVFYPVLDAAETARFYYQSRYLVSDSLGATKERFTADTDTFRLDEDLLRLGLVFQWKMNKGRDYGEDMASFEFRLAQEISRDRGSRDLRLGRARSVHGVEIAYPRAITG